MHPKNPYLERYNIKKLVDRHNDLEDHIILNPKGEKTINFSSADSVYELNKALLLADFDLKDYQLPRGYLIPPIPGRLEYLLHMNDFMANHLKVDNSSNLIGLDTGTGANGIYCILAAQYYNWNMVGADCDLNAVEIAKKNLMFSPSLAKRVKIRHQTNKSFLFKNIIQPNERFDFTICNPPFFGSKEEAKRESLKKIKNINVNQSITTYNLNFEGQSNELWCNGGEALFLKRMIKESVLFKNQVKVFSSLVSKSEHLLKIKKQLTKINADSTVINMELGNKKSRIVLWWFK